MKREKPRCCKRIWNGTSYLNPYNQCSRAGVIEHEGNLYCRQHSPEAQAKRDQKSRDASNRNWAHRRLELAGPDYSREVGNLLHAWDGNLDIVISQCIDNLRKIHEKATGREIKPPELQLEGPKG